VAVIVDTDVVSFLLKKDTRAELYRPHLDGLPKIISFMTLVELRRWKIQNNWGVKNLKIISES
jgi:tRNA(fMet)-specific endonuclease VapC